MTNKSHKSISLILPVYNEEKIIVEAVDRVYAALDADFETFEIILIDDGSRDSSYEKMVELQKKYERIKVLQNLVNLNQGVSIQRGFAIAKYEYVLHNGIDLPLKPSQLRQLITDMGENDLFVLERNIYSGATLWRKIVSKINIGLRKILFPKLSRAITDMNFVQIYKQNIINQYCHWLKALLLRLPK